MTYPEPRYLPPEGAVRAVLRRAARPPDLEMAPGGTQVSYLATGATTGGDLGLYRWEMPAEPGGARPHFHRTISESFYVLDGTVRLFDGTGWLTAGPGDFLHVPPGGIHGFRNEEGPASMLILFVPGAPREAYFEELAAWNHAGYQPSDDELADLLRRHDQTPA